MVLIDDLPENILERFICGFYQSVSLQIVRRATFMHYRVKRRQAFHYFPHGRKTCYRTDSIGTLSRYMGESMRVETISYVLDIAN